MPGNGATEPESAPLANETRGEVSISLEGVDYVLRPSRDAIRLFEKDTGKALIPLARAASDASLTVDEAAAIVTRCIQAWGSATGNSSAAGVNANRVSELLVEEGMLLVQKRLELLLFIAATGGVTSGGQMKAPTTMAETTAPTQTAD